MDRDPTSEHPAQWSPQILDAIRPVLQRFHLPVHDPFAGTGVRLGALCDDIGLTFTGTEMVGAFIADDRVKVGDSTDPKSYPAQPWVICTSPVYPNGCADHFKASEPEGRHTYRQALHRLVGHDVPLAETNMGRYSVRRGTTSFEHYAVLAHSIACWWFPMPIIVNVSDFYVGDVLFPLVQYWRGMLQSYGWRFAADIEVATPRQRRGANGEKRHTHETVLVGFPGQRIVKSPEAEPESAASHYAKLLRLFGMEGTM